MSNKASGRDYSYDKAYEASEQQKKRRAARNAARRIMMKLGKVHRGDNLDIDHKTRNLDGNLSNAPSNLRVQTKAKNRARHSGKK
jgi:hypothetical protein